MEKNTFFRRQFLLSVNSKFTFEGWSNLKLDLNTYLTTHPDLEIVQSSSNTIQLTLLGYIIDPCHPLKSNQEILDDLIDGADGFKDVVNKTEPLGGRWIIIYKDSYCFNLFHDPCGQRQVYFFYNNGNAVIGSDPAIINHFVKLEKDVSFALNEFINSSKFKKSENSWIGPGTIFKNVKHLLPNYYLEIQTAKLIRYWPSVPLKNLDLVTAVDIASELLTGSLKAISNRHKLVLAVTGGWDSRVLLSASKEFKNEIIYFVSVDGNENQTFPDILIPTRLFKQLGIPFYVQKCDLELDLEFKKMLQNNVTMARVDLAKAKYIYKYHLEFNGMLSVNGNLNEIARSTIRPLLPLKVSGANLAKIECIDYSGIRYVTTQLDAWLEDIGSLCVDNKLNIYDMLYWEQRMGNWGAHYASEQDISIEQFSPFNNRLLLMTLLSVDEKYRRYPSDILYFKIMEKLWPETLLVPLGMYGFKSNSKEFVKYIIRRLSGIYK